MNRSFSKIMAVLLCICMLVPSFLTVNVFADTEEPTITVSDATTVAGNKLTVDVVASGNPGINSFTFSIVYDSDNFTLDKVTVNPALGGQSSYAKKVVWLSSDDLAFNGVLFTLELTAKNDVSDGEYPVSVSYNTGDICNRNEDDVNFTVIPGKITVLSVVPGDINGDFVVNNKDLTRLLRYLAGEDVTVNDPCLDTNGDGNVNNKDLTRLLKFLAGEDVELFPKPVHRHDLVAYAAVDASCTENGNIAYWYCTKCLKYFSDAEGKKEITFEQTVVPAKGHTWIAIPDVAPTYDKWGSTGGTKCSVCGVIGTEPTPVEPLVKNEFNISYNLCYVEEIINGVPRIVENSYLKQQFLSDPNYIYNNNYNKYTEGVGFSLETPSAAGYDFMGWYELPEVGAKRVYSISSEDIGDKILYAVWTKHPYTITYLPDSAGSTLQKIESEKFYVDTETALQVPSWPNLVWVGWSDDEGNVVKSIPKGTAHDVSLTANWMSRRNQTVPKANYASSEPAILEDYDNGIIAFAYEIGDIQNVPIQQVEEGVEGKGFNLVKGQQHSISKTFTQKIDQSEAQNASETIANATTKSDSWTLSENWNERTSFSQEHSNEVTEEQISKASQTFAQTNKYSLSSGVGGSREHIDENGKSTKVTKKQEFGIDYNAKVGANIGLDVDIFKAGISGERSLGLSYKNGRETTNESYEKHTDKTSTNWNLNQGFETSSSLSATNEFSQKLGQSVKDTYSYGEILDFGGSSSNTVSSQNTNSQTRAYSSSVTYRTESGQELTVNETLTGDADTGFYRKVIVANFRVFGVIIYDIKNRTFSTMTYSLKINNSDHLFTDYSTVSSFNDYENGVLPFEVPSYVGDYIYSVVGASDGLRINSESGIIEGYGYKDPSTGICYKKYDVLTNTYSDPCDTDVIIPRYIVVNRDSSNKEIVKVNGILDSAFSNSNVTSVHLNKSITAVPNGAFENCSQLKYITGPSITSIGTNAFKNCSELVEMNVSSQITELGSGAFDGCEAVTVFASSPTIVDTAMSFDVDELTIDLNNLNGTIDGKSFEISSDRDYFCINGGGKSFSGVTIDSSAGTTELNNITLFSNNGSPLKSSSSAINLGYTKISSNGFAVNLTEPVTITLNGNNYVESTSENAMLSKSLVLVEKENSTSIGRIRFAGNALVYGEVMGAQLSSFDSGAHSIVYLTAEEYDKFFNSMTMYFDADGGSVDLTEKSVYFGEPIGELPVPTRDYYTFTGWYTVPQSESEDESNKVTETSIINSASDITLYAHWELNPVLGWIPYSEFELIEGAQLVQTKWVYTLKEEKSSSESVIDGWELDHSERTSWGPTQGPVYSNPSNGSRNVWSEPYETSRTHYYKYYHYANSANNWFSYAQYGDCQYYKSFVFTYKLTIGGEPNGGYRYYHDAADGNTISGKYYVVWYETEYDDIKYGTRWYYQEPVYTYYYYRYLLNQEEFESDPTGRENVSDVVEWVQYRAK